MEIQNLINFIENNGLHYITCRLQMTWGQSDKVELILEQFSFGTLPLVLDGILVWFIYVPGDCCQAMMSTRYSAGALEIV